MKDDVPFFVQAHALAKPRQYLKREHPQKVYEALPYYIS